jgi:hypothetical protein
MMAYFEVDDLFFNVSSEFGGVCLDVSRCISWPTAINLMYRKSEWTCNTHLGLVSSIRPTSIASCLLCYSVELGVHSLQCFDMTLRKFHNLSS